MKWVKQAQIGFACQIRIDMFINKWIGVKLKFDTNPLSLNPLFIKQLNWSQLEFDTNPLRLNPKPTNFLILLML